MHLRRLTHAVKASGTSFWNQRTQLIFDPNPDPRDAQWYWVPKVGMRPIPITADLAQVRFHRVQLVADRYFLDIAEHLLAPRALFPGVTIIGSGSPPYHGRGKEFFDLLFAASVPEEYTPDLYTVSEPIEECYAKPRRGFEKPGTRILPAYLPHCGLSVFADYPKIGAARFECGQPDDHLMAMMAAKTPSGFDRFGLTYRLSQVATRLVKWPHHEAIAWVQEAECRDAASRNAVLHGAQDALGLAAFLFGNGYFVGEILRVCSGHAADLRAVKRAAQCLVPFKPRF